jgi:hypothetical protein
MENSHFDEIIKQADKDVIVYKLPNAELESFYKTIKCLQNYSIKLNMTPDLNWSSLLKFYRKGIVTEKNDKLEQILLGKNIQLTLRGHTAAYLDKHSRNLNHIFDELLNFSNTFLSFYPTLEQSIKDTIKGSQDKDYEIVLETLIEDIKKNKAQNDQRVKNLHDFSEDFDTTFDDLGLLKDFASTAFKARKYEIELLEAQLKKLEDEVTKADMEVLSHSFDAKTPLRFQIVKMASKNKDEEKTEKEKQTLQAKIAKLRETLSAYSQDYANLKALYDAADQFHAGLADIGKDVSETSHVWQSFEFYFRFVNAIITPANIENNWVRDTLSPNLNTLNDWFKALTDEIKKLRKILLMDVVSGEKNAAGEFVEKKKARIVNSKFLELYLTKVANLK